MVARPVAGRATIHASIPVFEVCNIYPIVLFKSISVCTYANIFSFFDSINELHKLYEALELFYSGIDFWVFA